MTQQITADKVNYSLCHPSDGVLVRMKELDTDGKPLPGPATGAISMKSASVGRSLISRELAEAVEVVKPVLK